MSMTMSKHADFASRRAEERFEFNAIFAVALLLFLVAALVQAFVPRAWRANPDQPLLSGAFSAARTVSKFAFMG